MYAIEHIQVFGLHSNLKYVQGRVDHQAQFLSFNQKERTGSCDLQTAEVGLANQHMNPGLSQTFSLALHSIVGRRRTFRDFIGNFSGTLVSKADIDKQYMLQICVDAHNTNKKLTEVMK